MTVEFGVLGPVEVRHRGSVVPLGGTRPRSVLALLLCAEGNRVSTERFVDMLWGDDPPARARSRLHTNVSRLRASLGVVGTRLLREPGGYRLVLEPGELDLHRAEQLLRRARVARRSAPAETTHLLRDALACWRGPGLADLVDLPGFEASGLAADRVRFDALQHTVRAELLDAELAAGHHHEVLPDAEHAARTEPLRERPHLQLATALSRSGRSVEALTVLRSYRARLADEAGLDPSTELAGLERAILEQQESVTPSAAVPAVPVTRASRGPVADALPSTSKVARELLCGPGTTLHGRETELGEVARLLEVCAVVTLTGMGGVGKTRTACAAACEGDRDVALCELAAVTEPEVVPFAVADALGFPSLDAASQALGTAPRLLVLDNCEHLLEESARTVRTLRAHCPGVRVLATSREPLGLPEEHVLALDVLALPATEDLEAVRRSPAVRLLCARAEACGARIDLDADAAAINALCRRLDGLPLALELAAARLRSLTPQEVLDHLERRLRLLQRTGPAGPERHRSLEAAIGWSYDLLPEPTQCFLDRLGVFSGRFTAEHAHAVAGAADDLLDTLEQLDRLVAASVLTVHQQEGRSWYSLLATLRRYTRDRLDERGDRQAARDRWVDSILATAEDARRRMVSTWPPDLFVTLQNLHADVGDALRWCVAHDEAAVRAMPLFIPMCSLLKRRSALPVAELRRPRAAALARRRPAPALRGGGRSGRRARPAGLGRARGGAGPRGDGRVVRAGRGERATRPVLPGADVRS